VRIRLGLAALVAVAGSLALGAAPASACMGTPCDEINFVCKRALGAYCLG
jgi:hypothetical protein